MIFLRWIDLTVNPGPTNVFNIGPLWRKLPNGGAIKRRSKCWPNIGANWRRFHVKLLAMDKNKFLKIFLGKALRSDLATFWYFCFSPRKRYTEKLKNLAREKSLFLKKVRKRFSKKFFCCFFSSLVLAHSRIIYP